MPATEAREPAAGRGAQAGECEAGRPGPLGLCLAGPTGCGKTALALAFARELSAQRGGGTAVEIVSVDSALVYRGMDIGTAKPSAAERAEVPHHLVDIVDPANAYSAAAFAADARRIAAEIRARGRLPLLVGGTMLYFKALREGIDTMPAADAAVRAALDAEAAARGWPALHAELARVDPLTAQRLAPNDAQRIQRALEVWRASGRPLSAWQSSGRGGQAGGERTAGGKGDGERSGRRTDERIDRRIVECLDARLAERGRWPMVSLEPTSRAWLHDRLAERFAQMLAAGLVDEVRALRGRGDLHAALPAMRCVGYRQAWAALDSGSLVDLEALRAKGVAATRQLAKRQLTWLRSMPGREVVPCDAADAQALGIAALARHAAPFFGTTFAGAAATFA
ncbi:MAG: tRNA (adenosine(37)-N6)-dimethylallyltransferase MiaA [Rubrivivax sp.]|nr:tRNA (adenosine(37)-N6)-dimethylallyltransferase MiaA [Rubrivivax sp.]